MKTKVIAKIAAYKAYRLGREAIAQGRSVEAIATARRCLDGLGQDASSAQIVGRRQFYQLVLAELHRSSDPLTFREAACELGEILETLGEHSSFREYMKIVAATDLRYTTGNFGDLTTGASSALLKTTDAYVSMFGSMIHVDLGLNALELCASDFEAHTRFLEMSLDEIALRHGL